MAAQTSTHATLLARLGGGADASAWNEFYDRYAQLIRGFALQRGLQPADCDDLVQDVVLKLTRALPGFTYDPARGKFRSYLKTVVLRVIFDRAAQKRGAAPVEDIEESSRAAAADEAVDQIWEGEWRRYHMRLALHTIEVEFSERDRRAFQRYAVENAGARDTADELGMSLDQVYQAKSQILRRLSELIAGQVAEEG